jgi:hypothetical protein
MTAPIIMFMYNRPIHATLALEALSKNELAIESDLTIFCDGPKSLKDVELVRLTREVAYSAKGFRSVRIVERATNMGLANSIINGVTDVCNKRDRVIVLEDDLVTAPSFLRFMNNALDKYQDESRVGSIHGYWYPVDCVVPDTFFLRGASCWGWATWSRAWQRFESDGLKLLKELRSRNLQNDFDLDGAFKYTNMLKAQVAGRNNSWAIRWHASAFIADLLQLSPGKSLIQNIGFDYSGTHCSDSREYDVSLGVAPSYLQDIPIEQSEIAHSALINYYRAKKQSFTRRALGKLSRIINGRVH